MIRPGNVESFQSAGEIVSAGGVVAFRTDTLYGLGVDPLNRAALNIVRKLKGREDAKPILVLISDLTHLDRFLVSKSTLYDAVSEHFWPGPLTIIGLANSDLPDELTAGSGTIGVRFPDNSHVQELIHYCGGALTATSANPSGSLPARSAEEVQVYFPDGLDLILDDGEVTVEAPSTVLDLSTDVPRIIREGMIRADKLAKLLPQLDKVK